MREVVAGVELYRLGWGCRPPASVVVVRDEQAQGRGAGEIMYRYI